MPVENIIGIVTASIQIVTIFAYIIVMLCGKSKNKTKPLEVVANELPNIVREAMLLLPNSSKLQLTNYILATLKTKLEEEHIKLSDKKLLEEVEKSVNQIENI